MKLHNVIGGLEEKEVKASKKITQEHAEATGHNQLCNREIEVDEKEMLSTVINRRIKEENGFVGDIGLIEKEIKAISKAISQGKVLKITKEE